MAFHVMCSVSGGATGSRSSLLKRDGEVMEFETREAAEAEAAVNMARTQGNPNRTASFNYWAVED